MRAAAQFLGGTGVNEPVYIGGGSQLCWSGSQILGQCRPPRRGPPCTTSTASSLKGSNQPQMQIEKLLVFDHGDGISFDAQPDANWSVRGVRVKYSRDDCLEDDLLNAGIVDDSFFDGCYDVMSGPRVHLGPGRGSTSSPSKNSLMRLQPMDAIYETGQPVPQHEAFWKWSHSGSTPSSIAPSLAL